MKPAAPLTGCSLPCTASTGPGRDSNPWVDLHSETGPRAGLCTSLRIAWLWLVRLTTRELGGCPALLGGPSSYWAQGAIGSRRAQQNSTVPGGLAPGWASLPARLRLQITPFQVSLWGENQIHLHWLEGDPSH